MKVFKEDNKAAKEVAVKLKGKSLIAVDSVTGGHLAVLLYFNSMLPALRAEEALETQGYRTDFAKWNEFGAMVQMLEDFE